MNSGPEYEQVERPLLSQLEGLDWTVLEADKFNPTASERQTFQDSILESRFRAAITKINPGPDGTPWLDDARQNEALAELAHGGPGKLIEINERKTRLLLEGVSVQGMPGWDHGRTQHIRFIDFQHPENNDFFAISQFRMDEPGGQAKLFVVPDVVLFVNGIPLVVIECKNPGIIDPMAEGIKQLRRYANQRDLGIPEGNERLFWTNQFVISTHGDRARVGTFTSGPEHYLEWKHPYPLSMEELSESLHRQTGIPSGQELLVAGMLAPRNLLDIVRHFVVFTYADGTRIKIVARYQQYRAVGRALNRLRTGSTRAVDGESDRRGGLIWHTQGSGKSLTMIFLVRAMRSDPALRSFKVVFITDRTDLETQLVITAKVSGETVERITRAKNLKKVLAEHGPSLVFAMIQKYRDTDQSPPEWLEGDEGPEELATLNDDDSILILVDEAHRSQTSALHARLMAALPNAAKIGFTGTPIMSAGKKKTASIFGPFIDKYTIREAEEDEAVVRIFYEGRTAKAAVTGGSDLDQLFEDMFVEQSQDEIENLKSRYATTGILLEAPGLIAAKARSMMWHYISAIFPAGFKAQVAATSRLAAVRYRDALMEARDDFVSQVESLPSHVLEAIDDGVFEIDSLPRETQVLVRARPHLDLIRALVFIPVISGDNNDDPTWARWTDKGEQEKSVQEFKKPLGLPGDKTSPVAFLIVRTMLLTGFDAPVEQVLYLDRLIQDAELLQAIARVNRTATGKSAGFLVDYFGVGAHLQRALKAYAPEDSADVTGVLATIKDELPKLGDRHARVLAVFAQAGIETFDTPEDVEACVQVLSDESLRVRFDVLMKSFLTTLDVVLPRQEGLQYARDAKRLGLIQKLARRRYRDEQSDFDPSLYGEKVRKLIDEHILALDIAVKIPPISITDPEFVEKLNGLISDKAKASEMEHALRFHIRKNFDQDPARFQKLSDRLEEILRSLVDKWDQLTVQLGLLLDEMQHEAAEEAVHPDPLVARFYGVLEREFVAKQDPLEEAQIQLLNLAMNIVRRVATRSTIVRFWQNFYAQEELHHELRIMLDDCDLFPFEDQEAIVDSLMELTRANRDRFVEQAHRGAD